MTELDVLILATDQQSTLTGPWPNRFFCNAVILGELTAAETIDLKAVVSTEVDATGLINYVSSSITSWSLYDTFQDAINESAILNEVSSSATSLYIPFSLDRRIFEDIYA